MGRRTFPRLVGVTDKSSRREIYRISTPHDLGAAIQKMLAQLGEPGGKAGSAPSHPGK